MLRANTRGKAPRLSRAGAKERGRKRKRRKKETGEEEGFVERSVGTRGKIYVKGKGEFHAASASELDPTPVDIPVVSLELKERNFDTVGAARHGGNIMCPNEGYVVISNNELMCGNLAKKTLGSGSKKGLFYVLTRDGGSRAGPIAAAEVMNRMTRMCTRWLTDRGFSIGIDDVTPSTLLRTRKGEVLADGYAACEEQISLFQKGELQLKPGCDLDGSLEAELNGILSKVRSTAGDMCMSVLPRHNAPRVMSECGSKGGTINICQMVAAVGQQTVGGKRAPEGFLRRALPHFPFDSKMPAARGFVANSFYNGLTAQEFFFHTMGGREGLVDTAVKTAETGYMSRRLMKALEDLSVQVGFVLFPLLSFPFVSFVTLLCLCVNVNVNVCVCVCVCVECVCVCVCVCVCISSIYLNL